MKKATTLNDTNSVLSLCTSHNENSTCTGPPGFGHIGAGSRCMIDSCVNLLQHCCMWSPMQWQAPPDYEGGFQNVFSTLGWPCKWQCYTHAWASALHQSDSQGLWWKDMCLMHHFLVENSNHVLLVEQELNFHNNVPIICCALTLCIYASTDVLWLHPPAKYVWLVTINAHVLMLHGVNDSWSKQK